MWRVNELKSIEKLEENHVWKINPLDLAQHIDVITFVVRNRFMSHISWTSKCCPICAMIYGRSIVQVSLICRPLLLKIILTERKKEKTLKNKQEEKKSSSSCAHMIIRLFIHICFFFFFWIFTLVSSANVYFIFVLVTHKYVDLENCLHAYVERKNLHVAEVCMSVDVGLARAFNKHISFIPCRW